MPVGSWIGYTFGWPAAFLTVVALTLATLVAVLRVVPRGLAFQVNDLATLGAALTDWRSLLSVLFTASFIGAIYVLYTYLAPLLAETMGYGCDGVSLVLFAFGAGAVLGNVLGGRLTDRFGPFRTLAFGCTVDDRIDAAVLAPAVPDLAAARADVRLGGLRLVLHGRPADASGRAGRPRAGASCSR